MADKGVGGGSRLSVDGIISRISEDEDAALAACGSCPRRRVIQGDVGEREVAFASKGFFFDM